MAPISDFGDVTPPDARRLVYINGDEPGSLDPGMFPGGRETPIINALFEGLTRPHPATLQPMAGLATHYEANAERTQFTFYLRGHPTPFFLRYQTQRPFYPVPRHVIAAAAARGRESSWTAPDRLVTSGAFMLAEHRPYDRVVVKRNPRINGRCCSSRRWR